MNKIQILDCPIASLPFQEGLNAVHERIATGDGGYVCFANVHTVVTAQQDERLASALQTAYIAFPDGRPVYLVANLKSSTHMEQIAGPDFMPRFIGQFPELRHFFMGSTPETLELLVNRLKNTYPTLSVAGTLSPPFKPLSDGENQQIIDTINACTPDIIWVGLGAPKQEYWMADNVDKLKPAVLMGVGAAFDFHAGTVQRAPIWMQKLYLEWFHRLMQEPGRLWKRYLLTNSRFIAYLLKNTITGWLHSKQ